MSGCGDPSKPGSKGGSTGGFQQSTGGLGKPAPLPCKQTLEDSDGDCVRNEDDANPNDPKVGVTLPKDPRDWTDDQKESISDILAKLQANGAVLPDNSGQGTMLTDGLLLIMGLGVVAAIFGDKGAGLNNAATQVGSLYQNSMTQQTEAQKYQGDYLFKEREATYKRALDLYNARLNNQKNSPQPGSNNSTNKYYKNTAEATYSSSSEWQGKNSTGDEFKLTFYFPTEEYQNQNQDLAHVWTAFEMESTIDSNVVKNRGVSVFSANDRGQAVVTFFIPELDSLVPTTYEYSPQTQEVYCAPTTYDENNCSGPNISLDEDESRPYCDINGDGICGESGVQLTTMKNDQSGFIKNVLFRADALNPETGEYNQPVPFELTREGDSPFCNAYISGNSAIGVVNADGYHFGKQSDFINQGVHYLSAEECGN